MAEFHHGISKKEPTSGIIPMRDADTNVIALIAFSDDADEETFPLDTPTLVTSINRALAASGSQGNLRNALETMSAITSPTLVVIRIEDPFKNDGLDQSLVIGTTLDTGQRTGIQALLTTKSILGITPKIIIAPDVETPSVVQALAAVNKKLRAFSYVTPRDEYGVMLETMELVTAYRDTLSDREIMLIWPEFTSGNVFLGKPVTNCDAYGAEILAVGEVIPIGTYFVEYRLNGDQFGRIEHTVLDPISPYDLALFLFLPIKGADNRVLFSLDGGSTVAPFHSYLFRGILNAAESINEQSNLATDFDQPTTIEFRTNPQDSATDAVQMFFGKNVTIHACAFKEWPGY